MRRLRNCSTLLNWSEKLGKEKCSDPERRTMQVRLHVEYKTIRETCFMAGGATSTLTVSVTPVKKSIQKGRQPVGTKDGGWGEECRKNVNKIQSVT